MTTASVSRCSVNVDRAASLTAIRALSFSIAGSRMGPIAKIIFWRFAAAWKVPTSGPSAAQQARSESEGIAGSCKCNKSNSPCVIHWRTRAKAIGPNRMRATAPL